MLSRLSKHYVMAWEFILGIIQSVPAIEATLTIADRLFIRCFLSWKMGIK